MMGLKKAVLKELGAPRGGFAGETASSFDLWSQRRVEAKSRQRATMDAAGGRYVGRANWGFDYCAGYLRV